MGDLNQQLSELNHKVDSLYGVVERLNSQMGELLFNAAERRTDALHTSVEQLNRQVSELLSRNHERPTDSSREVASAEVPVMDEPERVAATSEIGLATLQHKDILIDNDRSDSRSDYQFNREERSLSPETQVRRLTAQVTAAYNRIAALEEQLLSLRSTP